MRRKGISYFVAVALALTACNGQPASEPAAKVTPPPTIVPYDYGNGVYYFGVTEDQYRRSLAVFLKKHTELRCRYFGADDFVVHGNSDYAHSRIVGHTLVCTDIAQNAQDETVP